MSAPSRRITALAFDPAGEVLALATPHGLDLRAWPGLELIRSHAAPAGADVARTLAFHPDGDRVAVTRWGQAVALLSSLDGRVSTPGPWDQLREAPRALAHDADGRLFALDGEGLWRLGEDAPPERVVGVPGLDTCGWVWCGALLPRQRRTLVGRNDEDALRIDWRTGEPQHLRAWLAPLRPSGASVFCFAVDASETCIAFGGKHPLLQVVWTEPGGTTARSLVECPVGGRVVGCALHPREPVAVARSLDGTLHFFDTRDGARTRPPLDGYDDGYPW